MARKPDVETSGGRRETLRVIGAVGVTCAFPFSADELYGQHAHGTDTANVGSTARPTPYRPAFLSPEEYRLVDQVAELIIPATDTPGAREAGVAAYIDQVLSRNPRAGALYRDGLKWLNATARKQHGRTFLELEQGAQLAILRPLADAADQRSKKLPERFFREIKSMTADGYYTSRAGLLQELGYSGNTALATFPTATLEE